jgi:hypothetical protein
MYRSIFACVPGTTLIHGTPDCSPISCPLLLVLLCRNPVELPGLADTNFAVKQLAAMKSSEPLRSFFWSGVKLGRNFPLVAFREAARRRNSSVTHTQHIVNATYDEEANIGCASQITKV